MPRITSRQIKAYRAHATAAQDGLCFYCDGPMWETDPLVFAETNGIAFEMLWSFQCTTEHLKPRCDGGGNERENIAVACRLCNQHRHELSPVPSSADFRTFVQTQVANGCWPPSQPGRGGKNRILVKGGSKLHWMIDQRLD